MLENFLPPDLRIPKVNPHLEAVKVKTKKSSTEENEIVSVGSPSVSKFQCHLCPFSHQRRSKLYCHYAVSHYRQQLISRINLKKLDCHLCDEKKTDLDSLLMHLGNTHKIVEEFLPTSLHLSRSRNRLQSSQTRKDRLHLSPSKRILWRNDSIPSGEKRCIEKSDPENNVKKIKSSHDDPVKEEEDRSVSSLKKKMQSIFGDNFEDSD